MEPLAQEGDELTTWTQWADKVLVFQRARPTDLHCLSATLLGWTGIGSAVRVHEGSTVVVVLNALRLLAFHDREQPADTA